MQSLVVLTIFPRSSSTSLGHKTRSTAACLHTRCSPSKPHLSVISYSPTRFSRAACGSDHVLRSQKTQRRHASTTAQTKGSQLVTTLRRAFDGVKRTTSSRSGSRPDRIDVVSDKLCDDTIKYLAPSLEKHRGCTIIDFHPGPCLWSRKIHDFLQPKRHLLVEPDARYFDAFIRPLLEQPGSKYRHTNLEVSSHLLDENLASILGDEDLFPLQQRPTPDTASPETNNGFNPDLLVIGNLARHYKRPAKSLSLTPQKSSYRYSCAIAQHLAATTLTRRLYNANGAVRSLWWMPQVDVPFLLPLSLRGKSSTNTLFQMAVRATEVVKVDDADMDPSTLPYVLRAPALEDLVRNRVKARMIEDGLVVPAGRELAYPVQGTKNPEDSVYKPLLKDLPSTCDAFEQYIKACEKRLEAINAIGTRRKSGPGLTRERKLMATLEFPQARVSVNHSRENLNSIKAVGTPERGALANDLLLRMIRAEAIHQNLCANKEADQERVSTLRVQLERLGKAVWDSHASTARMFLIDLLATSQELFALATGLVLPRDARRLEPLRARLDEYYPHSPLALIDAMPTLHNLGVEGVADRDEAIGITQLLMKQIFQGNTAGIIDALERAGPGASSYILPRVPELTDVMRGGRMDAKSIRVRMLTETMLVEIAKSFIEWPFRPTKLEMELADFNILST